MSDAKSNRAAMPRVAAFVDELRSQGVEVRVIWASENGLEVGRMPEYRNAFDIPANYRLPTGAKK